MEIVFAAWIWLASGDIRVLYSDEATCRYAEQMVARGEKGELEDDSGARDRIITIRCMGAVNPDPCEMQEGEGV